MRPVFFQSRIELISEPAMATTAGAALDDQIVITRSHSPPQPARPFDHLRAHSPRVTERLGIRLWSGALSGRPAVGCSFAASPPRRHLRPIFERLVDNQATNGYCGFMQNSMDRLEALSLACYDCGRQALGFQNNRPITLTDLEAKTPRRRVVRVGRTVNRADPTETYDLECGHTTI
jgi:hypothetical protein